MQDNNNNLFTQMFGLESEDPKVEPPKKTTEPSTSPISDNSSKENNVVNNQTTSSEEPQYKTEQKVIIGNPNQNNDLEQLNYSAYDKAEINDLSSSMITTTNVSNESIELSSNNAQETPKYSTNAYDDLDDFTPFEESDIKNGTHAILKVFLILIIVLFLFGSWYFMYNVVLAPKEEKLSESTSKSETQNKEVIETNENMTESITFDETLSFDHGLTINTNELNQTVAYIPNNKTGVIKCSTTESITTELFKQDVDFYLYYENHQLKKTLQVSKEEYLTEDNYQLGILIGKTYLESWEDNKGIKYSYIPHNDTKEIETKLLLNLAYGSYYSTINSEYYVKSQYSYNENIKTSINKTLNLENYKSKITCSTVET